MWTVDYKCVDMQNQLREHHEQQARWDQDFLALARFWALRKSKDPSTKVGSVIVAPDRSIVSMGYNGFPIGVADDPSRYADRDIKLSMTVHAEINAFNFASRSTAGCTLYTWPFMPCSTCAGSVINKGIKRVVAPPTPAAIEKRWGDNLKYALLQFEEAGVQLWLVVLAEDEPQKQETPVTQKENIPCSHELERVGPCLSCGDYRCDCTGWKYSD